MPRCVFYCSNVARSCRATRSMRGLRHATAARPSRRWRARRTCARASIPTQFNAAIDGDPCGAARGRFVSGQLHVSARFRCVRLADRALSALAGAAAGAVRRADRVAGRQVGVVVLAGVVHRERGRHVARPADERHGAALGRSRRGSPRRRVPRKRSEKSRRKRDDRRPAAQRSVARGADGFGQCAGAVFGRAVCVGLADDVDGAMRRCAPARLSPRSCARCFRAARSPVRRSIARCN